MDDLHPVAADFGEHRSKGWAVAIAVFILSLFISSIIVSVIEKRRLESQYHSAFDVAIRHSTLLQTGIEQQMALTYTFAALLKQGNGTVSDFEAIAEKLISFYPSVTEIALARAGIITNVFPLKENEAALGKNLLTDPQQSREARFARDSGKLTLAGPLELFQGGKGIVGRLPVFIGKKARFWGFVIVVIRMDALMEMTLLSNLSHEGYHYTLTRLHPVTGDVQTIASSADTLLSDPVEQTISLPNTRWTLSVAPLNGWHDLALFAIETALAVLISFLLGFIAKQFVELRGHRLFLEELVAQRTAEITETKNRLRTLLDTIPDPVWLKNREGVFLLCNPVFERLIGAKEEQIVGKTDYDFFPPEIADSFRQNDLKAMQIGDLTLNEEWLVYAQDGHSALMETIETPVFDEHRSLIGILGIARDIHTAAQRRAQNPPDFGHVRGPQRMQPRHRSLHDPERAV